MIAAIDLTVEQCKFLMDNSIERFINTAIEVANRSKHPDSHLTVEEGLAIRPIATKLWMAAQNALVLETRNKRPTL